MRAKVSSTATGEVLLESVLVVKIRDGRLGFSIGPASAQCVVADPQVTLAGPGGTLSGVAEVVRSGSAYEEVRGRSRQAGSTMSRWVGYLGQSRQAAVVLVRVVS